MIDLVDEDFEVKAKRAEAAYRAEIAAAYGDETAGRDTGRMARHRPGETSISAEKRRERDAEQRLLSALDRKRCFDPTRFQAM